MPRHKTPAGLLVGVFLCLLVGCGESVSADLVATTSTESACASLSPSTRGVPPAYVEPSAHREPSADKEPSAYKEPSAHIEPSAGKAEWAELAGVIDGDTLRLKDGRTVRVLSINAPELGRRGQPGEPFSRVASNAAQAFLNESHRSGPRRIRLVPGQQNADRYGRVLAHVYRADGASLEEHLLAQGLAFHSPVPPNLARSDCYAELERRARKARLGIWSDRGIHPTAAREVNSGGYQRVRGQVTLVSFRRNWWLELDNRFTVVIHPPDQHRFEREDIAAWQGKTVEIQGWVYPVRGELRMKLETPWVIRTE